MRHFLRVPWQSVLKKVFVGFVELEIIFAEIRHSRERRWKLQKKQFEICGKVETSPEAFALDFVARLDENRRARRKVKRIMPKGSWKTRGSRKNQKKRSERKTECWTSWPRVFSCTPDVSIHGRKKEEAKAVTRTSLGEKFVSESLEPLYL